MSFCMRFREALDDGAPFEYSCDKYEWQRDAARDDAYRMWCAAMSLLFAAIGFASWGCKQASDADARRAQLNGEEY